MRRLLAIFILMVLSAACASAQVDLCTGLQTDKLQHPMRPLAKPAVGVLTTDPDLGGKFRRITNIKAQGTDPFIKPMYSPVPAWNADESYLLLYAGAGSGVPGWWLYDGKTYAPIKRISVAPADVEQVWWDSSSPKIVYWPSGGEHKLYMTNVDTGVRTVVHDFHSICSAPSPAGGYLYGDSHSGVSWDTDLFGFACGQQTISYRKSTDSVVVLPSAGARPLPLPSGQGFLLIRRPAGVYRFLITDTSFKTLRELDIREPSHYSMGWKADGRETLNMVTYDGGPRGSGVGSLVVFNLNDGSNEVVVGQTTGYLYPRSDTHISGTAFANPGWLWQSHGGGCNATTYCPNANPPNSYQGQTAPVPPKGIDLLDNEITITDTNTGRTCRVMHHRSYGKFNKSFAQPYWGEPHVTASPSGTRAVFASDWGGGATVDTYVIELPSYRPADSSTGQSTPPKKGPPPTSQPAPAPTPDLASNPSRPAPAPAPPQMQAGTPSNGGYSSSGETGFGGGGESGYSFAARPKQLNEGSGSSAGAQSGQPSTTAATKDQSSTRQQSVPLFLSSRRGASSQPGSGAKAASSNGRSVTGGAAPKPGSGSPSATTNTATAGTAADHIAALPTGTSPLPAAGAPSPAPVQAENTTVSPRLGQGLADLGAGRHESAVKNLVEAVKADPGSAVAHYYLGYTYYLISLRQPGLGDYATKAAEQFTQAYRIDPTFTPKPPNEGALP